MTDYNHEDVLREKMLAFEREQVKKKLRPRLPCDMAGRELSYSERKSLDRSIEKKDRRTEVYKTILNAMGDAELLNSRDIGSRTGYNTQTTANFLRFMVNEELVAKIPRFDSHGSSWAYVKTGKKVR
jgi:hypothetical protein